MFVATRNVTETTSTGDVVTHPEGSHLAQFALWDNAVKAALLRMGYVREVADAQDGAESVPAYPAAAPALPQKATVVVTSAPLTEKAADPQCPHCPDKIFANNQGLKLHMTRMHARAAQASAPLH